jgi:hypothetical protein
MSQSIKTYAKTLPRHLRIVIFVDCKISEIGLRNLMQANLHVWGGRYNPIVPVYNKVVAKEWIDLIANFDPDYVYYSKGIELQYLKDLYLFHPIEYVEIDDNKDNRYSFPGVNIHNLLHEHVPNYLDNRKLTLLQYGKWNMPLIGKEFYELNLGFKTLYSGENKWTNKFERVKIDELNLDEINTLILESWPYFKSILSSLHVNSICIESKENWENEKFQWVVYDEEKYFADLIYFWNRQLYIEPRNKLNQVVSSMKDLEQLVETKNIEGLLFRLSISDRIYFVSSSVDSSRLNEVVKTIQSKYSTVRILTEQLQEFPFKHSSFRHIESKFIKPSNDLILGKTDFLRFPVLAFEGGNIMDNGSYVLDVAIERDTRDEHKEIKFPYGTFLHHLVCKQKARVNNNHRISIYVDKESQGTDFTIPSDGEIIKMVLRYREYQKEIIQLPIDYIELSNAGQKLSSFYNLLNQDWSIVKEFLEEKFWLQLFKFESEVEDSSIPSGKGVFSHKDLDKEVSLLFKKYRSDIVKKIREVPELVIDDTIIDRIIERDIKETFKYNINPNLEYLVKRGGLFIGMKVNCEHCGSNKWYSLTELRDKFNCKGCNNEVIPNINSKIYYKLSEVIINNLLSDQIKNSKHFDGNYVVLKTLLYLKDHHGDSGNSFIWCPPLEYTLENKYTSDLDILVVQNGSFIVGEAKNDSGEFTSKVRNSLIWVADNLMPDKIILACNNGNLDQTVDMIKAGIKNKNCEVISYQASRPWYHFGSIFGMPRQKEKKK